MTKPDYQQVRDRINGLVLNIPTPFVPRSFDVDLPGLRRNVDYWVASGVKTLLLTYGTSEFCCVRDSEIADVTRAVVESAGGRALVIASTGRWWLGQTVEFAHFCEKLGADALMITIPETPGWNTLSDFDGHVEFHRQIQERSKIPLVYLLVHDTGRSVEATEKVCAMEHYVGAKIDVDSYPMQHNLGRRLHDKTALICGGGGLLAYWSHQWGYHASLTGVGQWAPRLELSGVDAMVRQDIPAAKNHLDRITPFRQLAASISNHAAIKYAMDVAGLAGGPQRPPQRALSEEAKARLRQRIAEDRLLEMEQRP
jgi:4-hydroxy-tetrahydrodipicolinate synthase